MHQGSLPPKQGLYDPANEHDACGVGFVAHIKGKKSHDIVKQGLTILNNIVHRGAVGADPKAGDGAGILMQIPDAFFRDEVDFDLPAEGEYGVGMLFFPKDNMQREALEKLVEDVISEEGQRVLGWRDVPVDPSDLGVSVKPTEPTIRQVFIAAGSDTQGQDALEKKLFVIHKIMGIKARKQEMAGVKDFYTNSMSTRTIVYKGMLLAEQVGEYYLDLSDERIVSAIALVHQRFSTNTFPTWDLAHPFRMVAHNGEINTNRGNVNWMKAREHSMRSEILGDDINKIWPVIAEGQSDTACFDNALELMVAGGYSLSEAMTMLIPEAWSNDESMDDKQRAYYEYNAALMEPWDGPAAVVFTDGRQIGAVLDRNGLRPARYLITDEDMVVMASEMGVLDIPQQKIVKKWRLEPGKMFLIDLEQGRIIDDKEIKSTLADAHPFQQWLDDSQVKVGGLTGEIKLAEPLQDETLLNAQQALGYTQEDLKFLLGPMVANGMEGIGSMGADNPPAVLSNRSRHLSNYFKQNFAQVTNPPIDPIREEIVMSLVTIIGPRPNLLGHNDGCSSCARLEISQPILSNEQLYRILHLEDDDSNDFHTKTLDITYLASEGAEGMKTAIDTIRQQAKEAVEGHYNILILSDRKVSAERIAIPSLLATSAVHQFLVVEGLRTETGLVIETGAALEVHHYAALAGYGAEAINPWLVFDTIAENLPTIDAKLDLATAHQNYIKAVGKGLKKIMSKMGISTYQSYCGAQIFDAVGLSSAFVEEYFTGTATTIEGIGVREVAEECLGWHNDAYGNKEIYKKHLDVGGDYAYRLRGEKHVWTPDSIAKLQHAVRGNDATTFTEFSKLIDEQSEDLLTLRGLMDFQWADKPVSIDDVEPVTEIVKRFATGAMSFGSISYEAHSTLAVAMNQIGAKSNTGEGGEEASRFNPLPDGSMNPERSAIKQVASGRFGVTTEYLVNADDIQIKMAQGAKPGEGGQLPGHKVNEQIGRVRYSTPGVGLISPPPHHDIYSIEDLAQLIHDLKNVNPKARISVKLVSEVGVGTVAAGVTKAHADHITISGYDGGTGASPLNSIKHAGSSWEIGLAETHQTLVLNKLRSRVCVQADGGLRTGRDVVIAALLGADEFGFATAPLIAEGCIMMRKCHLNTCPVGVATQDPELRKRFKGKPEHVINYFFFVAEEMRQLMAKLGFKTVQEMIGQSDRLSMRAVIDHWKAQGLDYSRILTKPVADDPKQIYHTEIQDHGIDKALDHELIAQAQPALASGEKVNIAIKLHNYNRTFGTMLSGEVAMKYGINGLPEDTISIKATGTAGQSFGAWLMKGITIELEGEGNDYVGKGISGGKLIIYPPADAAMGKASDNIIAGNTLLFGAIAGEAYLSGVVGERFCVRNSGVQAVVEGVGNHGCEYMTGGIVTILGDIGRNFAAGMSGGMAYVLDRNGNFASRCNMEMVELESISKDGADVDLSDLTRADETRLKGLIENHQRYTRSERAKEILDNWDEYLPQFIKVMPVDYKRALQEMKKA